ncbi:MAG: GNAT family N-acetyltransferase [Sulfitobacter sp.]
MLENGLHDIPRGKVANVVTHLEMTTQAKLRNVSLPDGVTFRAVTPDVAWYRDIFHRVGANWLWYGRRKQDDTALTAILNDPQVEFYTLDVAGRDEALLELDFRQPDACELAYFGLTSELIGTGAGGHLMDRAIQAAWSKDISRFHVHTCTNDSPQALSFYRRSGFTPYRQQVEIEDDPRLSGILPETAARHVPLLRAN